MFARALAALPADTPPDDAASQIVNQDIELVLTAHPTEAQRRTILKKHQRIVELLGEYDKQALLTPGEIAELKDKLRSEQLAAWRTSNVRRSKPSAEGEARNGLLVIEETCWDAVPEHYRRLDRSLARIGQKPLPYDACIVRISTWMGGDRDGNPNVTSRTTEKVGSYIALRRVTRRYATEKVDARMRPIYRYFQRVTGLPLRLPLRLPSRP